MIDNTVLITGSSRGIGRDTALEFAYHGYNVVVNYNNSEKEAIELQNEINTFNKNIRIFKCDVSNRSQAKDLVNFTIESFKKIDILVNNAGISYQTLFTDITLEEWKKIFEVNVEGMFNCSQFAVKNMLKYHRGKIINVSSVWGMTGASCEVHYSASKAAIIGFTKALAKELGPSNIQVNCVAPGVINTEMNKSMAKDTMLELTSQIPLGRIGTTKEIAKTIFFLSGENSDFITGQIVSPNGGFLI
jgi:3-oxoacyl-[acyl-carrier protein] reductase